MVFTRYEIPVKIPTLIKYETYRNTKDFWYKLKGAKTLNQFNTVLYLLFFYMVACNFRVDINLFLLPRTPNIKVLKMNAP